MTNLCSTTRRRLIFDRLFPVRYPKHPEPSAGMCDGWMTTRIVIHAGWLDRLRLLLSGKALVTIYQQTDVEVGNCKSSSAFCVIRPGGGDQ